VSTQKERSEPLMPAPDYADLTAPDAPQEPWGPDRPQDGARRSVRRALVLLHSSTWPRRLVPARVAFPLIEAYAGLTKRTKAWAWEENYIFHGKLLRHTPLAGTEDEVARRAVIEFFECVEMFWRPWLMRGARIEGMEHYRAARATGRGILTAFPHFGMPYAQFPIMRQFGIDAWVIASPHHYMDLGNGYDARFARHGRRAYVDLLGEDRAIARRRGTTSSGAFEPALDLLRGGNTLSVAFDVNGSMPTPFLGRQLSLASGPPKLAHASEALVVPFVIRRNRQYPILRFERPIDSRDYADATALQAAIAGVMEQWALEEPQAVWQLHTQPGGPPLIRGPALSEIA
jgi:lauroyl/myristoyl acyltransferase